MTEKYNKLVRDGIPSIIRQQGHEPRTRVLDDGEYFEALNCKLGEELEEYRENFDLGELADMVEVIHAIVKCKGMSLEEFEEIRMKKYNQRGGFAEKIYLVEVERQLI